tara:strand:- start:264 stop:524 length:261 start_codon:yes stop_codon:yes gene_type:complete
MEASSEIDPRQYRGKVEIQQFHIPTHVEDGKRYDSGDGVAVDEPVRGQLVDYYGDQWSGDNVLVNLEDGRSYWFRWDETKIKAMGQ